MRETPPGFIETLWRFPETFGMFLTTICPFPETVAGFLERIPGFVSLPQNLNVYPGALLTNGLAGVRNLSGVLRKARAVSKYRQRVSGNLRKVSGLFSTGTKRLCGVPAHPRRFYVNHDRFKSYRRAMTRNGPRVFGDVLRVERDASWRSKHRARMSGTPRAVSRRTGTTGGSRPDSAAGRTHKSRTPPQI